MSRRQAANLILCVPWGTGLDTIASGIVAALLDRGRHAAAALARDVGARARRMRHGHIAREARWLAVVVRRTLRRVEEC